MGRVLFFQFHPLRLFSQPRFLNTLRLPPFARLLPLSRDLSPAFPLLPHRRRAHFQQLSARLRQQRSRRLTEVVARSEFAEDLFVKPRRKRCVECGLKGRSEEAFCGEDGEGVRSELTQELF